MNAKPKELKLRLKLHCDFSHFLKVSKSILERLQYDKGK